MQGRIRSEGFALPTVKELSDCRGMNHRSAPTPCGSFQSAPLLLYSLPIERDKISRSHSKISRSSSLR